MDDRPTMCDICGHRIEAWEDWQRGLDGGGAHLRCVDTVTDEEDDYEHHD